MYFKTADVAGLRIFYREAGDPSKPTIVLLHGFPSSSYTFHDLIPPLADRFHVIAPDYPGMGFSEAPAPTVLQPTFDDVATVIDAFIAQRAQGGVALGQEEWQGVCLKCHRLDHAYIGPALGGNPVLADRNAIAVLLRNGQGQMPSVGKDWTNKQFDALIAYTKRFAKTGGAG